MWQVTTTVTVHGAVRLKRNEPICCCLEFVQIIDLWLVTHYCQAVKPIVCALFDQFTTMATHGLFVRVFPHGSGGDFVDVTNNGGIIGAGAANHSQHGCGLGVVHGTFATGSGVVLHINAQCTLNITLNQSPTPAPHSNANATDKGNDKDTDSDKGIDNDSDSPPSLFSEHEHERNHHDSHTPTSLAIKKVKKTATKCKPHMWLTLLDAGWAEDVRLVTMNVTRLEKSSLDV